MAAVLQVLGMVVAAALLATLALLLPFGLAVGLHALIDPEMTLLRRIPGLVLFSPWLALTALIAAGMLRPWWLLRQDPRRGQGGRIWRVRTARYADDPSGAETVNDTPGRAFLTDYLAAVAAARPEFDRGVPIPEDYGWGAWIAAGGSPAWVAFSAAGRAEDRTDETVIAVVLEPPPMPWQRLRWRPDFALRDALEAILEDVLRREGIAFAVETGPAA